MKTRYVALLRGINVGGNNLIKMADLRASLEGEGFANVATFIASGNVLFDADAKDTSKLVTRIEKLLTKRFSYTSRIVLRSHAQLQRVVERRPKKFGEEPTKFRYDVWFIKEPREAAEVLTALEPKPGVDTATEGAGVIYTTRLVAKAAQSRLIRVMASPLYQDITIRNWNTTQKLAALT